MSHNFRDIAGRKFGRLTVVERAANAPNGKAQWLCRCDCGNLIAPLSNNLLRGRSTSCGCARSETVKRRLTRHGHTIGGLSVEYKRWKSMKERCGNPNQEAYPLYGARGIRVCDRWLNDFSAFVRDMGPIPSPKHTIERKDNSLGYEPDNCVWATVVEQANNRSTNRILEVRGARRTMAEACRIYGASYDQVRHRLRRGWTAEEALGLAPRANDGAAA